MKNSAQGVKETAFGLLPVDWDCLPLGELVNDVSYGSSAKSSSSGLVPVLRMGNLQGGFIDWGDLVYTSDTGEIEKYTLEKNDVLFNRTNTVDLVGKTAIYKGERPAIYAGYLIKIDNKKELLNSDYLNYVLNTHQTKSYNRLILSVAVSQANINGQKLKTYPIPLPPTLGEQVAIADALQDVDSLLVELEKLIAKKQAIKTASMQQLLTGKKRLPEFALHTDGEKKGQPKGMKPSELGGIPEDWDVKAIGDISNVDPENLGSSTAKEYEFEYISLEQVDTGKLLGTTHYKFENAPSRARRVVKQGDVLLSTVRPNLKSHLFVGNEVRDLICSTGFSVVRSGNRELDSEFIYHHLFCHVINNQIEMLISGSNYPAINSNDVRALKVAVPCIKEQTAIATILSDMDREIQSLEQRLAKTRQIKQGMMQELLTGRTRLPLDKD